MLHVIKTKTCFSFPFENKTLNNGLNSFLKVKTTNQHKLFSPSRASFLSVLKPFSQVKNTKPTKTSEPNYGTLTFPLHTGIRRHLVTGLDQAQLVNTSFFSPWFLYFPFSF